MNDGPNNDLRLIWPKIADEIACARKKKKRARILALMAAPLVMMVLVVISFVRLTDETTALFFQETGINPWQRGDVNAAPGSSKEYPLIASNHVCVIEGQEERQHLVCLDKSSGAVRWRGNDQFSQCRLVTDQDLLYILYRSNSGPWTASVIERANGQAKWTRTIPAIGAMAPSTLTLTPGGICWSQNNSTICLDSQSGDTLWTVTFPDRLPLSAPLNTTNGLYVASHSALFLLDAATGKNLHTHLFQRGFNNFGLSRPMVEAGSNRIFVTHRAADGKDMLRCLAMDDQQELWAYPLQEPLKMKLVDGCLVVRARTLLAFDVLTGRPLWQNSIGGCSPIFSHGDRIYLVDAPSRSKVLALDVRTGKSLWKRQLTGSCNGIVISGKQVFVTGNDHVLYALGFRESS